MSFLTTTMLAEAALKSTLLLLVAGLVVAALRRRSPAVRHLVWTGALAGALLLPLLGVLAPRWSVGLLPPPPAADPVTAPSTQPLPNAESLGELRRDLAELARSRSASGALPATTNEPDATPLRTVVSPSPSREVPTSLLLLAIWAAGAAAVLAALVAGHIAVRALARTAAPIADPRLLRVAGDAARKLGVARRVEILRCSGNQMPATWGIVHPTIVLPAVAELWTADEQRVVLLHELSHVKRFDSLTQLVAQLACAVYWFNPAVWYAARRMREERERACDVAVLDGGADACRYAEHLLHVARAHRSPRRAALAALSMARPSQLEGRLVAILDAPRSAHSRRGAATVGAMLGAATLALSALSPWRDAPRDVPRDAPSVLESAGAAPLPVKESSGSPVATDTVRMSFPMRAGQVLEVMSVWGNITALPAAGSEAEVVAVKKTQAGGRAALDRVAIQKGENDAGVKVCARYPNGGGQTECSARGRSEYDATDVIVSFTVRIPRGVRLAAHTTMGNVVATALDSYVWATSAMGNLTLSTSAFGEGSTSAGNITASLGATTWGDNMEFETGAGHVVVEIPAGVRTSVEGQASNGAIGSDFPLEFIDRNDVGWIKGRINGGSARSALTLRSQKGNVFLRRASGRQSLGLRALDSLAAINPAGIHGAVETRPDAADADDFDRNDDTSDDFDADPNPNPNPDGPGDDSPSPSPSPSPSSAQSSSRELDQPYRVTAGGVTDERVALDLPGGFLHRFTPAALDGQRDSVAILKLAAAARKRWIAYQQGQRDPGVNLVGDRALWALTQVRNGGEIHEGLVEALRGSDWRTRAYAAWALSEVGGAWATGMLSSSLEDPQWRVRQHAAVAVGTFRAKWAVPVLIRLLEDPQYQVRTAAADALGNIGDVAAVPALRKAAQDPHTMVRDQARAALEMLGRG